MKIVSTYILIILAIAVSCTQRQAEGKRAPIDTIPILVTQIQQCNRLYTAEAHIHKIITHDDQLNIKGSLFRKSFNIHVPGTDRKIAIPMDANVKAYIDFSNFNAKNIYKYGEKIEIVLPNPKLTLTSSKIDHNGVKQFVSFTRRNYSDAELSQLEQQGRLDIIKDIPQMPILEQARQSAAHTLIPMLIQMGFKEENIKVSFRKKFNMNDIKTLLDQNEKD